MHSNSSKDGRRRHEIDTLVIPFYSCFHDVLFLSPFSAVVRALEKAKSGGFPPSSSSLNMEKPKSDSISSLEGISDEDQEGNSDGDSRAIKVEYHEFVDGHRSNSNHSFEPPAKRVKNDNKTRDIKTE